VKDIESDEGLAAFDNAFLKIYDSAEPGLYTPVL